MIKRIILLIIAIVFLGWICIVFYDSQQARNGQPKFCLSKETINYDDGTVDVCHGLGYKVFSYNRGNNKGVEFAPFWAEPQENIDIK